MKYKKLFIGIGISAGFILLVVAFVLLTGNNLQRGMNSFKVSQSAPFRILNNKEAVAPFARSEGSLSQEATVGFSLRKIIRNGSLQLVVDNIGETVDKVRAIAEGKGGFLASLTVSDREEADKKGFLTIRVPVAEFTKTMQELKALARVVEEESLTGDDVTEQFVDLDAQLRNLKATESQLLEVLKQAHSVEDILKVRDRLSDVRGQIEQLEGRRRYLANQTDLATISITLGEEPTVSLSLKDFRPATVLKASFNALVQSLIVMFNIVVKFVIIWIPVIAIGGALIILTIWMAWKCFRALTRKMQQSNHG